VAKAAAKTAEIVPFEGQALATRPNAEASQIVSSFHAMAADPNVTPEKLNAMLDFQKRVMEITAKQAFDRDFAAMQAKLPIITKTGMARIEKDGRLIRETQYVRNVDITKVCRPIMAKFGFSLRFRNKQADGLLTVTGILSHREGHSEQDEFGPVGRDDSAGKNTIQSWGSARQYGKRYCTIALLDIATEDDEADDDGGATGAPQGEDLPRSERKTKKPEKPAARAPLAKDEKVISEDQRKRLWTIFRNSGRNEEAFRTWLQTRYKYDSTSDITRKHYDEIVAAIEAKGPLPLAAAKEQK
jgi:hypothetical protein